MKKAGCLIAPVIMVVIFVIAYFSDMLQMNNGRSENLKTQAAVKLEAFDLARKLEADSNYLKQFDDKYVEIEGVLTGISNNPDEDIIMLTSGRQLDSSYVVGSELKAKNIILDSKSSPCDSFMVSYQKNYNLREDKIKLIISGELVQEAGDSLLNFKYFPACKEGGRFVRYNLENFCVENYKIKGKIYDVAKTGNSYRIYMERTLILSKGKVEKKFMF
jgi:hypothetical protein